MGAKRRAYDGKTRTVYFCSDCEREWGPGQGWMASTGLGQMALIIRQRDGALPEGTKVHKRRCIPHQNHPYEGPGADGRNLAAAATLRWQERQAAAAAQAGRAHADRCDDEGLSHANCEGCGLHTTCAAGAE